MDLLMSYVSSSFPFFLWENAASASTDLSIVASLILAFPLLLVASRIDAQMDASDEWKTFRRDHGTVSLKLSSFPQELEIFARSVRNLALVLEITVLAGIDAILSISLGLPIVGATFLFVALAYAEVVAGGAIFRVCWEIVEGYVHLDFRLQKKALNGAANAFNIGIFLAGGALLFTALIFAHVPAKKDGCQAQVESTTPAR